MNEAASKPQTGDGSSENPLQAQIQPATLRIRATFARELQRALLDVPYLQVTKPKLHTDNRTMIRLECTLLGPHLNLDLVKVDLRHLMGAVGGDDIRVGDGGSVGDNDFCLRFVQFYEDGTFLTGVVSVKRAIEKPPAIFKLRH